MITPVLEELAAEYSGRVDIYRVNADKETELAMAFGITSIPTLVFCPLDDVPQHIEGLMTKADFRKSMDIMLKEKIQRKDN